MELTAVNGGAAVRPKPPTIAMGLTAIVLVTLIAYLPTLWNTYIWDDDAYVTENPALRSTEGLMHIWITPGATPQYYPLVFTSYWLEFQFWRLSPAGYHFVNMLLHAANAALLWLVLRKLHVPGAWLAAAVFGLHPVHVESVAWITERKNVLSGLFYLLALLSYLRMLEYGDRPAAASERRRLYIRALLLFFAALLSKSVTCSLPAAILLILWWKRPTISFRDVRPLIPMFVLGAAMAVVTVWMETHHVGTKHVQWNLTFVDRCLIAGRALCFYAGKIFWPHPLIFFYPRWAIDASAAWQYAYPTGVLGALAVLWLLRSRLGKGPLVAALFFAGTLFPALGFIDVYPMLFSWVADHFQYLASIGMIVLGVSTLSRLLRLADSPFDSDVVGPRRGRTISIAVILMGVLGTLTWQQIAVYRDSETLYRDVIARNPTAWIAHHNLGVILRDAGKDDEALERMYETLRLKPDEVEAIDHIGIILTKRGRYAEAVTVYRESLAIQPDRALTHNNLGFTYERQGLIREALDEYRAAVRLDPKLLKAHGNLANLLLETGATDEAITHYQEVVRLGPRETTARVKLASVLEKQGRIDDAIREYREVLQQDSINFEATTRLRELERRGRP